MEVFLYGGLPVWRSPCMEVFLYGGLPVWMSSCMEVSLSGGLPVRVLPCRRPLASADCHTCNPGLDRYHPELRGNEHHPAGDRVS